MPIAPNLLNDDGSASIATALLMSHHGFRRDITRFAEALGRLGPPEHVAALQAKWKSYHATLHGHHEAEDGGMFPNLRGSQPELVPVIDQLSAEHRQIDPLLEEGDRAFAELPARAGDAAAVVARLAALLDAHLAREEANVVPFLRAWSAFPPPPGDAEAAMYAEGFAWSYAGIAPAVLEKVRAMLPESVTSRLAAALAAFEARHERAFGVKEEAASTKSVPHFLPGGR